MLGPSVLSVWPVCYVGIGGVSVKVFHLMGLSCACAVSIVSSVLSSISGLVSVVTARASSIVAGFFVGFLISCTFMTGVFNLMVDILVGIIVICLLAVSSLSVVSGMSTMMSCMGMVRMRLFG